MVGEYMHVLFYFEYRTATTDPRGFITLEISTRSASAMSVVDSTLNVQTCGGVSRIYKYVINIHYNRGSQTNIKRESSGAFSVFFLYAALIPFGDEIVHNWWNKMEQLENNGNL